MRFCLKLCESHYLLLWALNTATQSQGFSGVTFNCENAEPALGQTKCCAGEAAADCRLGLGAFQVLLTFHEKM